MVLTRLSPPPPTRTLWRSPACALAEARPHQPCVRPTCARTRCVYTGVCASPGPHSFSPASASANARPHHPRSSYVCSRTLRMPSYMRLRMRLSPPHSHSRSASPRRHAITTGFVELHSMRIQFCHSCTILLQWLSGLYALRGRNASRKGPCMAVLVYLLRMKYLNINC